MHKTLRRQLHRHFQFRGEVVSHSIQVPTSTYVETQTKHTTSSKMADDELATRAPESDLAEQSAIPGDSAVDQGPSLGVSLHSINK